MTLLVEQFIIGNDNYAVLLHDPDSGATAAIDAMLAAPICDVLEKKNWKLTDIFVTHKHSDHIDGIAELKNKYQCRVSGPAKSASEIALLDVLLHEGDSVSLGHHVANIWETPGHCSDHLTYVFSQLGFAFVGDTLFPLGCGRIFDSTPAAMYQSLQRIAGLPDDMKLYSGHEYTMGNLRFALSLEPDNQALQKRVSIIENLREHSKPTLPTTVLDEKATNPFLRLNSTEILKIINMMGADPLAVLTELRNRKNKF